MNQMKKDLKTVAKDLKRLSQKTDKMIKRLEKVDKTQVAKKRKAKAVKQAVAKKPKRVSASGSVLAIIKRSRKGIDTVVLRKKTGFKGRTVESIIYRLKKEGKIKSAGRGLYVKA